MESRHKRAVIVTISNIPDKKQIRKKEGYHLMLDEYIKIKHYEDLFGCIALEKGFLTQDELSKAKADHVQEETEGGAHRHLREILFYQGTMSANQIEEVVKIVVGHPEGSTWK